LYNKQSVEKEFFVNQPIFSDKDKNQLAGFKMLYQHNLAEAKRHAPCSLQAAEALANILRMFASAVEKIRTPKNVSYILSRLKDNSDIQLKLVSETVDEQKEELEEILKERLCKNKCTVNRLRKNVLR